MRVFCILAMYFSSTARVDVDTSESEHTRVRPVSGSGFIPIFLRKEARSCTVAAHWARRVGL